MPISICYINRHRILISLHRVQYNLVPISICELYSLNCTQFIVYKLLFPHTNYTQLKPPYKASPQESVSPQGGAPQSAGLDEVQNQSANLLNVPHAKFRQKTPLINRIAQLGTESNHSLSQYLLVYIVCSIYLSISWLYSYCVCASDIRLQMRLKLINLSVWIFCFWLFIVIVIDFTYSFLNRLLRWLIVALWFT